MHCEKAAKLREVLTSLQALLRLATLRWLGVFICALATLLTATSAASALEPAQTKTRVWGFDFAEHNSVGLFRGVSSGKHQGNWLARAEAASGSLLAARGVAAAEGIALKEGVAAARGMQAHHIFSQAEEFAEKWRAAGINIEEFRVQLTEGTHLGQLHSSAGIPGIGPGGLWNETWRQYFAAEAAAGRTITQEGVFGQGAQMLNDFGVLYYSPL